MGSANWGVNANGFTLPRQPDIQVALETDIAAAIPGINFAPQTVAGQFIGVFAAALAEHWEQQFLIHTNNDPMQAEGAALDRLGVIAGFTRDTGETDETYRARITTAAILNATPQNAGARLCSALKAISGVTIANVIEDQANAGYEVVVLGGDDTTIAETIFAHHPTGMNIIGTTETQIASSCGFCQTIRYTRPTAVPVCFRLEIRLLPDNCNCDTTDTATFEDAIFQAFNATTVACESNLGRTYYAENFYEPLLTVQPVQISTFSYSLDGGTTYQTGPFTLGAAEYPTFDRNCIDVAFV